ncbi:hypothetical protein LPJ66_002128 [Kickxella alabastrina]|uniref:Uncharacterized protein n=1 Tax=Kickxella alabastrina TaxID=61397 RepID=A0ACC1IRC3_9FUNG|nr:hypothetical protein LPJ66_002128 [Kickxella alabastrina]
MTNASKDKKAAPPVGHSDISMLTVSGHTSPVIDPGPDPDLGSGPSFHANGRLVLPTKETITLLATALLLQTTNTNSDPETIIKNVMRFSGTSLEWSSKH